jgi:hypothetical protein
MPSACPLTNVFSSVPLDWFHITMRLTVLRQMTRSLPEPSALDDTEADVPFTVGPAEADTTLERVKHFLWHGNTFRALDLLADLIEDLEYVEDPDPRQQALPTRLAEFRGYLDTNATEIPNYGERHRAGEAISSATAESTVNQVM